MNMISRHWEVVRSALDEEKRYAADLVKTTETAFLPAALEIIERPVSPTARATTWALLGLLGLSALWLTFGKVDVVASAQGQLVPADNVKLVQPAEAGVIREIYVKDGMRVKKGQPLVALDPTVSGAEAEQARQALATAELDAARARAVLSALDGRGLNFVAPPGTPEAVATTQFQLAQSELAGIQAATAGGGADTRVASAARDEARVQAAKLTETLPLLDEQIAANEALLAKGFVSKLKVIEMRRQRLAAARDRDMALETIRKAEAQMASAGSGAYQTRSEARARILGNLAKAESDASLRREELVKSEQRSKLQKLLSPVDGTVAQLSIHTLGGVVEAAKPIMVIVPVGANLVAEARLLNKDAGFVRVGQTVAVKLEAFPFTRYGTIPGIIESIGSDSVADEKLGPVFPVRVLLGCHQVANLCARISSGMSVTADIRTGRRSILSYLVSPIDEARSSAGRER